MPLITDFALPASPELLDLPAEPNSAFFLSFHASRDPATGRPWCPDVIAALPYLQEAFSPAHTAQAAFVEVGQRPEWREPSNVVRTKWNVTNLPTLVRFERVKGQVKEVDRLVEAEILDRARLGKFVASRPARI